MLANLYIERAREFFYFQYDFVAYALGASVLVGIVCGLVGTFLVLRGFSLIGDATGHATLPGVAGAFVITGVQHPVALLAGALVSGGLGALTVGVFSRGPRVRPDAAIGIVLSVFFGVGIVLLAYIQGLETGRQAGLEQFLFGNAAAITPGQFWGLVVVGAILCAAIAVFYRPLALMTFDEAYAKAMGINTMALEIGLLAALSVAVVISIQAVGVILVAAMLIIPPSTGRFLSGRLSMVILWSMVLGGLSGALGAFISYLFAGVATGPAMVLAATGFFVVALLFGPQGGVVTQSIRRRRRQASVAPGGAS